MSGTNRKLRAGALAVAAICAATATAAGPASAVWAAQPGRVAAAGGTSASGARAKITADWQAFFNGKTPAAEKIKLVQDGSAFAAVINDQAGSVMAQSVSAKVSKVTLGKPMTTATVIYTITLGGAPALSNQKGTSVLQGGTWKVGAQSFCALLALEGSAKQVSVCKAK